MHNVLDPRDLVPDEAEQLLTSGYAAAELLARAREAAARNDTDELARVSDALAGLHREPNWPYSEPDDAEAIERALPIVAGDASAPGPTDVSDRLHGAWLGRCIGNTMGKPVEGLTRSEVELYLRAVGQWPQTDFVPLLAELPEGVSHLHESAPFASAGLFTAVPRDDDIDWTILGLHMLETYGPGVNTDDIAREWLDRLPFTQTFTAERAAYRNLLHGLHAPATATTSNPYREWIGALIRADIFGYVLPGRPRDAALLALRDARLSHTANGLYGEMWAAALVAAAFASTSANDALQTAVLHVPEGSRLVEALHRVLDLHATGADSDAAFAWFDQAYGHYNWVHTINNAVIISIGLLWGEGDFVRTLALTIAGANDTDSNGATVGSVFGAVHGVASVPEHLVKQIDGTVRSAVRGFDRVSIAELAERTLRLSHTFGGAR